jgi:hypothetical protein
MGRARTAVAIALLTAALAAAGCGLGPGEELGEATLAVTRDYGAEPVLEPVSDGVTESDTVIRVLDRNASISTRFGGGFVQSIEGLEGGEGAGGPHDWFFYVNGVESTVGAADYPLRGGEAIWWDHRSWGTAQRVPAVVGSWPQPFLDGYDGRRRPVAVECRGDPEACSTVRGRLEEAGVSLAGGAPESAIRVLVGPWRLLAADPVAAGIDDGPQASGVFADLGGAGLGPDAPCALRGLDESGREARRFGPGAGLVAATRRFDAPPVWVVTGCRADGVRAASELLGAAALRDRYAVAVPAAGAAPVALPLPEGGG